MNRSSIISFVRPPDAPGSGQVGWWVRLAQEGVGSDAVTVGEAAGLLDAVFQVDPCVELAGQPQQSLALDNPPEPEAFAAAVASTMDVALCEYAPDGSCEVWLRVYRSHLAEPYALVIEPGEVLETVTVQEQVSLAVAVDGASVDLEYPLLSAPTLAWAWQDAAVTTTVSGSTLLFSQEVHGTLNLSFLTEYDRVRVRLDDADSHRALCFFHGLVDDLDLERPAAAADITDVDLYCPDYAYEGLGDDTVDCYVLRHYVTRCACSEEETARTTVEESVDCPDNVRYCPGAETECRALVGSEVVTAAYVDCGEVDQQMNTQAFYEQTCCGIAEFSLPRCVRRRSINQEQVPIEHGEQHYLDLYGPDTRFVPVAPPGGICGEIIDEQRIVPRNCCDEVTPLEWDAGNSADVIPTNSSGYLKVRGGFGPYTWTVDGDAAWSFAGGGKTAVVDELPGGGAGILLHAGADACGSVTVTVQDICDQEVSAGVRTTVGRWEVVWINSGGGPPNGVCPITGDCTADYQGSNIWVTESGRYQLEQAMAAVSQSPSAYSTAEAAVAACGGLYDAKVAALDCSAPGHKCTHCFSGAGYTPCDGVHPTFPPADPAMISSCQLSVFAYIGMIGGWYYTKAHHFYAYATTYREWVC